MRTIFKYSLIIALCFAGFASMANARSLSGQIDKIIRNKKLKSVEFGIVIAEARNGRVIYRHNADKPFTPASNMKLVTSWAAMKTLGPNYNFVTEVGLSDDKLVIIGSGDPLLGEAETDKKLGRADGWVIQKIIESLENNGIKKIDGIIVDSTIFDDIRVSANWPKGQLNRSYACEVSGLNYNGNCVKIRACRKSGVVNLKIEPQTSYVKLINNIKNSKKSSNAIGSYRSSTPNLLTVFGRCRTQASFDVAIERPAAFFGILLAENLSGAGIETDGIFSERSVRQGDVQMLAKFETPIKEVLTRCNKDSFALAAECLFKAVAARKITGDKSGSWQGGQMAIAEYLDELKIKRDEYIIDDGSGLSSKNKLSANLISKVILDARNDSYWPVLKDSLATGGVDGTIRKYFRQNKYKAKVFAKSGYINGVRALSGLCLNGEKEYVFAILANKANGSTKTAIHKIVETIIDY
ncbi:MAG: D-alanyl-D-alanine carboxypeptidase/D-alanyl-D-alanine-endopeptidase [Anaerohalosphaeraceae bacterium]|nr:D-alanyl-D-alanine carboxypeptidase/D-alanyl-D-alanine-endopeptidase [Anaerohalosphaeraceae bacterium]